MKIINKRHILKSFSWRFIGTLDTLIVAWLVTGNINEGISLSIITTITKLIWFYIHEKLWFKTNIVNANKLHIIKTFSWRGVGTLDTIIFGWLITSSPITGLKIGGIETASKMLFYYLHEKLWFRIPYGLDKKTLQIRNQFSKKNN